MILRFFAFLLLISASISSFAQPISSNSLQLDFGQVNELQKDSLELTIKNPSSRTLTITEIDFFQTYGKSAFSSPEESFSISAGDSQVVKVYFQPRHNILHNSEMVLLTDSHRGSISIDLIGQGVYSNSYYSTTQNLEEEALKSALKARLAQGFVQKSYNQGRDQMFLVLDNWKVNGRGSQENKTVGAYTGRVASPYSTRTQAQTNFSFNTEHIFPQGRFNQSLPMRSDVFHLATTWGSANSMRGNLNFGTVTNADWTDGGSKRGNGVFEPRDDQKGRNARAMFYFVVRYQNYQSHMTAAEESILRQWHEDFPPDAIDTKRNEDIFAFQKNRNPFIDYPQFIERISSIRSSSTAPEAFQLYLSESSIAYDTVYAQEEVIYDYVIVNEGNQDLALSNFSLADNYLSFEGTSGDDLSLAPGESHAIKVSLFAPANTALTSSLSFDTNIPGSQPITIPITAVSVGANSIDAQLRDKVALHVYPNPAKSVLWVNYAEGLTQEISVQVFDMRGRAVTKVHRLDRGNRLPISLQSLPSGPYFLKVSVLNNAYFEKIWVE